jgi:phosphonate transport system substrate-binding protein
LRSLGVHVATRLWSSRALLAVLASLLIGACRDYSIGFGNESSPLRLGIFAADATGTSQELAARYQPVVAYFEQTLSRPVDLTVGADAGLMLREFEEGRRDAIFNRSIAFPHAHQHVGALPLVTRQEDRNATTVFLALASDKRQTLQDFRGGRLDFSLRLGSSYVMGQHHLEAQGIDPQTFFREVHFSGVADEAVRRLLAGQADLGVANSQAFSRLIASGALQRAAVKVVAETPPHVGQLWFVAADLPDRTRMQLRDAFLSLSPLDPAHAPVLAVLGASGFVPAMGIDYAELDSLMRRLGLIDFDATELP